MKYITTAAYVAVITLAGCAATGTGASMGDDRVVRLMELPVPDYYAKQRVAIKIDESCSSIGFNKSLAVKLNDIRNDENRGSILARRHSGTVDFKYDFERRSFLARYGADIDRDPLCSAGEAEIASGSLISAFLTGRGR